MNKEEYETNDENGSCTYFDYVKSNQLNSMAHVGNR